MRRTNSLRPILFILSAYLVFTGLGKAYSWAFTHSLVRQARAEGVYPTAVEAMEAFIEENYTGITSYKILSARPNEDDGKKPHVWYVIAEVHAAKYSDGSELRHNGCDAPGTFVMQIREGWFLVHEGWYSFFLGQWLVDYGLAGPGQVEPAIGTFQDRPTRMCQSG